MNAQALVYCEHSRLSEVRNRLDHLFTITGSPESLREAVVSVDRAATALHVLNEQMRKGEVDGTVDVPFSWR